MRNVGSLNLVIFQYPLIIAATTNDDAPLTGFQVFEGDTMLELEDDGITTKKAFNFDVTIPLIKVKKTGYTDADTAEYTIIDGDNTITANLPIKMVIRPITICVMYVLQTL